MGDGTHGSTRRRDVAQRCGEAAPGRARRVSCERTRCERTMHRRRRRRIPPPPPPPWPRRRSRPPPGDGLRSASATGAARLRLRGIRPWPRPPAPPPGPGRLRRLRRAVAIGLRRRVQRRLAPLDALVRASVRLVEVEVGRPVGAVDHDAEGTVGVERLDLADAPLGRAVAALEHLDLDELAQCRRRVRAASSRSCITE